MTFKDSLKAKDFVVTAHVNLAEAPDADSLIRQGKMLSPVVDAVQLTDNKSVQIQMSSVVAAALLIQQGIDPIVHMACRDRNRIALEKDLIGAAALGVSSVLVMRGKKIPKSKKLGVRNVTNAEVFDPDPDWTPRNLLRKCDAGANFVQCQLCFDMDVVRNYMTCMIAAKLPRRANFIMGLSPLPSAEAARWVRDNVKGALVPDSIIERLEQASDPELEGIHICAELLQELTTIPGVSGANLLALAKLEAIPAAIEASGVRPSQ